MSVSRQAIVCGGILINLSLEKDKGVQILNKLVTQRYL